MNRKNFTSNQSCDFSKSCQIEFFSHFYAHAFCSRRLSLHTRKKHIHCTYHSKAHDPRKKTWGAEGRSDASARYHKCLKLKYLLRKRWVLIARQNAFCSRCLSSHSHTKHLHYTYHSKAYDPRKKTWVVECSSDTPA